MGIMSRKAATLFSQDTLAFAANHKAKSERIGRPRNGKSRASLAFSSPQPSQDHRQRPSNWQLASTLDRRRVKLPCPPIEGDPAAVTWVQFRETYAALAEAAFAKNTAYDWRRAESVLDEEFSPKYARDLTAGMLEAFEMFVCKADYGKHRIENMVSRLHHMILWGCECGYFDRNEFGIGPDLRWPIKDKGTWTRRLAQRLGEAVA